MPQLVRHSAVCNRLRQRLRHGSLSDTGISQQHRIVFRAALQNGHEAKQLFFSANHGVQSSCPRQLREIRRVPIQRCRRRGTRRCPSGVQLLRERHAGLPFQRRNIRPHVFEDAVRHAPAKANQRTQQVPLIRLSAARRARRLMQNQTQFGTDAPRPPHRKPASRQSRGIIQAAPAACAGIRQQLGRGSARSCAEPQQQMLCSDGLPSQYARAVHGRRQRSSGVFVKRPLKFHALPSLSTVSFLSFARLFQF